MSLHVGVVLVEGNHTKEVEAILAETVYKNAQAYMDSLIERDLADVKPGIYYSGWTAILDPELVMADDETVWGTISSRMRTRVFTMICEGASGSYSFNYFKEGARIRGFSALEGEIVENLGPPLPSEQGLNLSSGFLEDEMITIMQKVTGVDFHQIPFAGEEEKKTQAPSSGSSKGWRLKLPFSKK